MRDSERPIITILTDFGFDGAAATCKGVMLGICRDAQIVDVSHTIRKYAIADGAFVLRAALPYVPVGVHVAIVDPGVGTARRPIAIQAERGDVLVGPDNGLLPPAADDLGGIADARQLADRRWWLDATSRTFHGRDIFSPVAAHLAAGTATFEELGPRIDVASLVRLPALEARTRDGEIATAVAYVDSFGNARLAGGRAELEAAFGSLEEGAELEVRIAGRAPVTVVHARTFGAVPRGGLLAYVDSSGHLALAEAEGSFAARTAVEPGDEVLIGR